MRVLLLVLIASACAAGARVIKSVRGPACERVAVWRDGRFVDSVCRDRLPPGLAVIPLDDAWAPAVFAPSPDGDVPAYRATYVALAAERFEAAGSGAALAAADRHLDPYGIQPALGVVRARLTDDARHACHDAVTDGDRAAVEAHLACDGLLAQRDVDGVHDRRTRWAVKAFQRGAMLVPSGAVDAETREAIARDSRERDYVVALRVLRERVVAATGLIEDGTAGAGPSPVLGRRLESTSLVMARGHTPLADAAPDRVAAATEAAARALGWTDPRATREFLARHGPGGREPIASVAVPVPARPAYHRDTIRLEVEVDRGDVWYDVTPQPRPIQRRAALIVYARVTGGRIPLVRWPTTIGGWQAELTDDTEDGIAERWKESPVGRFEWRELYVAPTWAPPRKTPDHELVRRTSDGGYALRDDAIGPGYRSAYGLAALVHHHAETDTDIRTHGTANMASLHRGVSHGCHRLLGVHALRLAGFLVTHVSHEHHGEQKTAYRRTVRSGGEHRAAIDTRGYLIRLDPPVPVEVLPGRIRSLRKTPR